MTIARRPIASIEQVDGLQGALSGKEAALGNPDADGKVLSSTTDGVRSWVAPIDQEHRDAVTGAHPISAVTGLQDALDGKPDTQSVAMRPWLAALAARDYAPARAVFWGTSMTEGGGGITTGRERRWIDRLTSIIRSRFPLVGAQPTGGIGYIPAFYASFYAGGTSEYSRITPDGVSYSGSLLGAGAGLGNRTLELDSSGDWIEFTFIGTGCDLYFNSRSVANSTATYQIDSGSAEALPVPTTTTTGSYLEVRGLSVDTHTLRVTWGSGQVDVDGIYVYNGDEGRGVHVYDAGRGSAKLADGFTGTGPYRPHAHMQPSLLCFEFGYNEFFANTPVSTFSTQFAQAVSNALNPITTDPTVAFIIWPEPNDVTPADSSYSDYVAAIVAQAESTTNGIVFDLRRNLDGYAADPAGMIHTDDVHLTDIGAAVAADALAEMLSPERR